MQVKVIKRADEKRDSKQIIIRGVQVLAEFDSFRIPKESAGEHQLSRYDGKLKCFGGSSKQPKGQVPLRTDSTARYTTLSTK